MILLEIPETKRKIYLPENLAECDGNQYADASHLIFKFQQGTLSYEDFRINMLYKLLNLKKGNRKLSDDQKEAKNSTIYQLSEQIDSFFEKDDEDQMVIKQYYIHNHTPKIHDSFYRWYGPADEFNDISFGQYVDALNVYSLLEQKSTPELLFSLMAIFYHKKGQKYDPKKVETNAAHFRHVHFGRVYGFFLLFASFQKYLFSAKVYYQGNELDLSILFEKEKETDNNTAESKIPGIGMLSIAHQLAESQVYGPIQEVRKTDFWEIILRLYDIRKRDLDHQSDIKKQEETAKANSKKK